MAIICEHGQLKRKCDICDLEEELAQYKKLKEWIQQRFDEEWTFEIGVGEVVDEILSKFEDIENGEYVNFPDAKVIVTAMPLEKSETKYDQNKVEFWGAQNVSNVLFNKE